MNLLKRLRHIAEKLDQPRQYGKTTLLAKAAKEIDAVLLVATSDEATHIQRTHGITSKMVDLNLENLSGPFLIDNHAVVRLFKRAADKIEDLEKEIRYLRAYGNKDCIAQAEQAMKENTLNE